MYTVPEVGGNRPVRTDLTNIRHIRINYFLKRNFLFKLDPNLSCDHTCAAALTVVILYKPKTLQ